MTTARPATPPPTRTAGRPARFGLRSALVLAGVSAVGIVAFFWPFLAQPDSAILGHSADAPWVFAVVLPLLLALALAELSEGGLDSRGIALLGVLAAVAAILAFSAWAGKAAPSSTMVSPAVRNLARRHL